MNSHAEIFGHPHDDGHDVEDFRDRAIEVSVRGEVITVKKFTRCSVCGVFIDRGELSRIDLDLVNRIKGWREIVDEVFGLRAGNAFAEALSDYLLDAGNLRFHLVDRSTTREEPACGKAPIINRTSVPALVNCGGCRRTRAFAKRREYLKNLAAVVEEE